LSGWLVNWERCSWTTLDWTVRSCAPWSRTATTSLRTISQKTTNPPNNSKIRAVTRAGSSLCKRKKRFVSATLSPPACVSRVLMFACEPLHRDRRPSSTLYATTRWSRSSKKCPANSSSCLTKETYLLPRLHSHRRPQSTADLGAQGRTTS
jgi:hypothetical protein